MNRGKEFLLEYLKKNSNNKNKSNMVLLINYMPVFKISDGRIKYGYPFINSEDDVELIYKSKYNLLDNSPDADIHSIENAIKENIQESFIFDNDSSDDSAIIFHEFIPELNGINLMTAKFIRLSQNYNSSNGKDFNRYEYHLTLANIMAFGYLNRMLINKGKIEISYNSLSEYQKLAAKIDSIPNPVLDNPIVKRLLDNEMSVQLIDNFRKPVNLFEKVKLIKGLNGPITSELPSYVIYASKLDLFLMTSHEGEKASIAKTRLSKRFDNKMYYHDSFEFYCYLLDKMQINVQPFKDRNITLYYQETSKGSLQIFSSNPNKVSTFQLCNCSLELVILILTEIRSSGRYEISKVFLSKPYRSSIGMSDEDFSSIYKYKFYDTGVQRAFEELKALMNSVNLLRKE